MTPDDLSDASVAVAAAHDASALLPATSASPIAAESIEKVPVGLKSGDGNSPVIRKLSSSISYTHSQSRSTTARRLQRLLSSSPLGLDSYPDHANARRLKRLDSFSHAELLLLQLLVERAIQKDSDELALHQQLSHPFLSRQREILKSVVTAKSELAASWKTASAGHRGETINPKLKKSIHLDYPEWRKKHFQQAIDQRLRLRRKVFVRLFPALQDVPRASVKRIFNVFDRNMTARIEFTELCEGVARCGNRGCDEDDRLAVVFEWFMEKHELKITSQGLELLDATARAIQSHFRLPEDVYTASFKSLCRDILRGAATVSLDDFYERVTTSYPQLIELLMKPFDVLAPLVSESELLIKHERQEWREGDAAYLVDASWLARWAAHVRNGGRSSDNQATNDESLTVGPISNATLSLSEANGTLKPGLRFNEDFALLSSDVWHKLQLLYGGGPALPRKIVARSDAGNQHDEDGNSMSEAGLEDSQEYVTISDRLRVHLYPLVILLRLMRTDSTQTSLLLARRLMISPTTTLKDLLHRLGLAPGVNIQSVSFWMRRSRHDIWRRIECSINAPRSSLQDVRLESGHDLIVDFKALPTSSAKRPLYADNRLFFSLFQPSGNDFVARDPGIECAFSSSNWNAQPLDNPDDGAQPTAAARTPERPKDIVDDQVGELYTGGQAGLMTNAGFFVNFNGAFKFKKKKPTPRLISSDHPGNGGVRATGLLNMGNTCFLNCALQCIGHSPVLREYFLSQRFLSDINKVNALGTKGKVAVAYGRVMDILWSELKERESCFAPVAFRDEFARHRTQFQESSQHDAHEFIVALLDSLHEDLNRKRGGVEKKNGGLLCLPFYGAGDGVTDVDEEQAHHREDGSSSGSSTTGDTVLGSTAWQTHAQVNSSIVVDLFHGQMRSETVCASCDERKVAFDPFVFLSVPIPEPKFIRVDIKILFQVRSLEDASAPIRQGFWLPQASKISDLCKEIATQHELPARRLVVVEVRRNRIKRIFDDSEALEAITAHRDIFAYERAWGLDDIPSVPPTIAQAIADPGQSPVPEGFTPASFNDLSVGVRVDGLGYHGDWHPGSVVSVSTSSAAASENNEPRPQATVTRALVHFDAFSSKWDKWFTAEDWEDENILPIQTRTTKTVEVFEVQVVHRRISAFPPPKVTTTYSKLYEDRHASSALEVFGVPMFVTIASNRTAHDLHQAILLQASRFLDFDGGAVPYETRVVDLDDVSAVVGVELPNDSSHILQHFATQSVVVLDWKTPSYVENEQQKKDWIPEEMAALEREHDQSHTSESILSNSTSLTSCLHALFKAEEISLDDHWMCERCGIPRVGTRRSDVWKLPDLVMIQLKRFQYQENGYRRKVRTMVDFPLRGLDFTPWMGTHMDTNGETYVYDLYAVANHVGGLARGHYTAYCKYDRDFEESASNFSSQDRIRHHRGAGATELALDEMWFRFDDDKVVELAAADVVTDAAYVLFYKRRTLSPHNVIAYSM